MIGRCPDCGRPKRPEAVRCAECAERVDAGETQPGETLPPAIPLPRPGGVSTPAVLAIVGVLIVLVVLLPRYVPRYQEEALGVRDRWTGELCRFGARPFQELAFCEDGYLSRAGSGWRRR
jgi:hypothetical protein